MAQNRQKCSFELCYCGDRLHVRDRNPERLFIKFYRLFFLNCAVLGCLLLVSQCYFPMRNCNSSWSRSTGLGRDDGFSGQIMPTYAGGEKVLLLGWEN